jgi:hypothetical protein
MRRQSREFRAESFELEGRLLLANAHALIPGPAYVEFQGTSIPPSTPPTTTTTRATPPTTTPTQVVGQQDGVATVVLTRNDNRGRLQVQVSTARPRRPWE